MGSRNRGYTLIEIAVVLVIVGLLLSGVLKGQELMTGARARNVIQQQSDVKAAYFGFVDRYRARPGDYSGATANIPNVSTSACNGGNGDGDGIIEAADNENTLVWEHLSKAGFLNGTYTCAAAVSASRTPMNPYGRPIDLIYDANYGGSNASPQHNLKTGSHVPAEILAEVDRKADDGNALSGAVRAQTSGGVSTTTGECYDGGGAWMSASGGANCGAAVRHGSGSPEPFRLSEQSLGLASGNRSEAALLYFGMLQTAPASTADDAIAIARDVLAIEAQAISDLIPRLDGRFADAVRMILERRGRVVVSGIGKSGHIARKIASTLASTGTPAFFVHPAEASHGDLGMVTRDDLFIALSNSGESAELLAIVPLLKRQGAKLISLTGNEASTLATEADVHLYAGAAKEACPLNLAPTASTTAALALGDALAVALMHAKGFTQDEFARSHPGGALGRKLLTHVWDVMRKGRQAPRVRPGASLMDALLEMSRGAMGMTAVVDEGDRVIGIYTDGDLRRTLEKGSDLRSTRVSDVMGGAPRTITAERLAVEAVEIMERNKVNQILVVDEDRKLIGALNMHDLFRAKVI